MCDEKYDCHEWCECISMMFIYVCLHKWMWWISELKQQFMKSIYITFKTKKYFLNPKTNLLEPMEMFLN